MKHTLLLFDIDGTILRTGGAGVRAMETVAAKLFGERFTFEGVTFSGGLDPIIFAEAAALNQLADHETHHERFRDAYLEELKDALVREADRVEVMPGIHDLLEHLRQRQDERDDVMLGLLTGNYRLAVPLKLAAVGVDRDWFTITAFGDEGKTRPDLVALAMSKYEQRTGRAADPARVVVIGDTPRDIACAKAHNCIAFAVATGFYSVEDLEAAGADIAVKDLKDPQPLLSIVDGR